MQINPTQTIELILSILVGLGGLSGSYILLRRASLGTVVAVLKETVEGYKEMSIIKDEQEKALRAEKANLQEQLLIKDQLYVALETTLRKERERSTTLEKLAADWQIERSMFIARIGLLESQVQALQNQQGPPASIIQVPRS